MADKKHVLIVSDNKHEDGFIYADLCDMYDAVPHMAALESDFAEYEGESLLSLPQKLEELEVQGIKPDLIVIQDRKNGKWPDHMREFMHEVATTEAMDELPDGFTKQIVSSVKEGKFPSIREAFLDKMGGLNDAMSEMMGLPEEVRSASRQDLENSELTARSIEEIEKVFDSVKFREQMKDPFHKSLANSNYSDAAEKYAVALKEKFPNSHVIATGLFSGRVAGFKGLVDRAYSLSNDYWKDEFKEVLYSEEKQISDVELIKDTINKVVSNRHKKAPKVKEFLDKIKGASKGESLMFSSYGVLSALESEGVTFDIKAKEASRDALRTLFGCVETEARKDFKENAYRFRTAEGAKNEFSMRLGLDGADVNQKVLELYADEVVDYMRRGLHALAPDIYNSPSEQKIRRS